MKKIERKKMLQGFSPFVVAGVVLILVPIFAFITMDNIREQNGRTIEKLTGKAMFLIRAFEAGTRTGMVSMEFGVARVQRLLAETALQPEVTYMMITTADGKILAHSNPEKVGEHYGSMPDISALKDPAVLLYREIGSEGDAFDHVFQVFKKFTPTNRRFKKGHSLPPWCMEENKDTPGCENFFNTQAFKHMSEESGKFDKPGDAAHENFEVTGDAAHKKEQGRGRRKEIARNMNWFMAHFLSPDKNSGGIVPHHQNQIIFAALDMSEVKIVQKKYLRHTIFMGFMFFVLGCAGIGTLLAFQGYRSARTSFDRVKAFSDRVVDNMPAGLITIDDALNVTFCNTAALDILDQNRTVAEYSSEAGILKESLNKEIKEIKEKRGLDNQGKDKVKKNVVLPPEIVGMAHELTIRKRTIVREITCAISIHKKDSDLKGDDGDDRNGRDDRKRLLEIKASPIWDDDQKGIAGYLFLFQDLTELRELKSEIDRSRRLASVGKLAAGVAHEIRNPLSSIKGFATYFKERYSKVDGDREVADVMIQEVERLNRTVSQLLELSRPLPVSSTRINIKESIAHSIKLVEHDLNAKGIKVDVNVSANLKNQEIITDPDRLNQILLNLYLNAMQAMEKNGVLGIKVTDSDTGKAVLLEVNDTGRGINEADMEHIFDPYFTNRPDGTGLGLAMVHRGIEALGAEIRVESQQTGGTSFFIKLPAEPDYKLPC